MDLKNLFFVPRYLNLLIHIQLTTLEEYFRMFHLRVGLHINVVKKEQYEE